MADGLRGDRDRGFFSIDMLPESLGSIESASRSRCKIAVGAVEQEVKRWKVKRSNPEAAGYRH